MKIRVSNLKPYTCLDMNCVLPKKKNLTVLITSVLKCNLIWKQAK